MKFEFQVHFGVRFDLEIEHLIPFVSALLKLALLLL